MNKITESAIEIFAIEQFAQLGYQYVYGPDSETPLPIVVFGEVKVEV